MMCKSLMNAITIRRMMKRCKNKTKKIFFYTPDAITLFIKNLKTKTGLDKSRNSVQNKEIIFR